MKKRLLSILLCATLFFTVDRGIGFFLNCGLDHYFGLNQPSEVLLIGHSHLMLAVDKISFERGISKEVSKYCREGVNAFDKKEMVMQYLDQETSESLQIVLYGVDQFIFTGKGLSKDSYKLFYPFMNNEHIDRYVKSNASDLSDYWVHKLAWTARYNDAAINSALRGWRKDWNNYKFGQVDISSIQDQIKNGSQRTIQFEEDLREAFEQTLDTFLKKNIKVVLVNTPVLDILNSYQPDEYRKIISYFRNLALNHPLIEYWDYNPEFAGRYDLFYDAIHLNPEGQKIITKKIVEDFNILTNE